MKLKRLDIHGFKSFYHRTTVVFDDGITAVVGPNGCGKSNVVDAIKWVMGEQGPKALRGSAMEDVLFSGSEARGPMGMCEVRLTFANDGSVQVPARWAEVDEIAVERRLERSQGSDYLLNKRRCRLADVQDLVAGTGVGAGPGGGRAYAIIEQGQIGRIVSAKAGDRRILIEEAAGITRYRNRKRLAERKMNETRQNLERVDDVVGEVESRLRSLKRQAKKAERYRDYRAEARRIALKAGVFEYLRLWAEQRHFERLVATRGSAEGDARRAVEAADARRAAAQLAEQGADEAARAAADALSAAERELQHLRGRVELLEGEARTLSKQLEDTREELSRGAGRHAELDTERAAAQDAHRALAAAAEGDADAVGALDGRRLAAQKALLGARSGAERLRRQEAEEAHAVARARADQTAAERRAVELRERAGQQSSEADRVASQQADLARQAEAARAALAEAEATIEAARAEARAAGDRRGAHREAAQAAHAEERRIAESLAGLRSRVASLEELERRREGLGEGSRAVLEAGGDHVLGAVPERLCVPAEYEAAVAAVLAERLSGVVVRDLAGAADAIAFLRGRGRGRGVFVSAAATPEPAPPAPDVGGVRGLLADLVGGDALSRSLLGDALLVDDLDVALALARDGLWSGTLVAADGTLLQGRAFLVGGADGADPAPLSRRREIRDLGVEIEDLSDARARAAAAAEGARAAGRAEREAAEAASRAAHAGELRQAEARKDVNRADGQAHAHGERAGRLRAEAGRLLREAATADEAGRAAAEALEKAQTSRVDRDRAIEQADAAVNEAEEARDVAVVALHEARTAAVARRERADAALGTLQRLRRQIADADERRLRATRSGDEIERRLSEISEQRAESAAACEGAQEAAGVQASALASARETHQEAVVATRAADEALGVARAARDEGRDALGEARLALRERELERGHVEERIAASYGERVGDVVREFHEQPPPSDEERARLAQLEALIEKMGEVNVGAIQEYEEVSGRHAFLTAQRRDLVDAMADLEQAIETINRTSRALFKETFEAVNEHFKVLFPRLFRGGRAELKLTEPEDLLETGIEMLAQPPGKKLQHVGLMSGGEKAMCAIALVFAVFRVKPSPFCLLDEVDAPLDDANIGRFNEIVREMSQTAQIVLITHNKRTMEIADVLYGVTMEESGVSKLVSVRMT